MSSVESDSGTKIMKKRRKIYKSYRTVVRLPRRVAYFPLFFTKTRRIVEGGQKQTEITVH
jgi:hypothetical protein